MCRKVTGAWLIIAFLLGFKATATQYAFQVTFTDKNNSIYSLSNPIAFLSSRALARRVAQGIPVDVSDIPVNSVYIDSVLTLTGGEFHETSRWFNYCVILLSDSTQIHALDGKSFISSVKLVAYYTGTLHRPAISSVGSPDPITASKRTTSSDALFYGVAWVQTLMVNGNYLYDIGYQGTGKLIAVLDAGFIGTNTHSGFDSLRNSGRLLDAHNFTLASPNVYIGDTHGTSVLSTMAGYVPGTYVGSAPLASYALYITEDDNSEQPIELLNMVSGIERADSLGADIVTTSLGYNVFDNPLYNFNFATDFDGKTTTTARAANMATGKGMLIVATAGNEGGNAWNRILTPGDADSALTIGSVDVSGNNAANSGYGPNAAGQIKPDVCTMGAPADVFSATGYDQEPGTSFSTPQVAGWAACLWQANPAATPYQIRQAIIRCASSYNTPGAHIGYGIPNFACTEQILDVRQTPSPASSLNFISASPNPFTDEIKIAVSPKASEDVDITLVDMTGKTVASLHQFLFKGYQAALTLPASHLPSGIYLLRAVSATQQQSLKMVKQ